jgi:hypothetical protein
MDSALEQLLEAWRTNNRISLFLIDHISDEGMKSTLSKRGGRNLSGGVSSRQAQAPLFQKGCHCLASICSGLVSLVLVSVVGSRGHTNKPCL